MADPTPSRPTDPSVIRIAYAAPEAGSETPEKPVPARWFGFASPGQAALAGGATAWVAGWGVYLATAKWSATTPAEIASLITAVAGLPAVAWAIARARAHPRPRPRARTTPAPWSAMPSA
jgi:hypothetical protein